MAIDAAVFWDPVAYSRVLKLKAFAEPSAPETHLYYLPGMPGLRRSVRTPDGSHHVLCQSGNHFLQLCICGPWPSRSVHLLTEAVVAPDTLRPHLRALEIFNHLCHGETVPGRFQPVAPNCDRLRFVLRALDGSLAGASYREIAMALIGAGRVQASWHNDNNHLKNRIRRAVQRGRALMSEGYRRLLAGGRSAEKLGGS